MTNGEVAYRAFEQALRAEKYAAPPWEGLPKQVAKAWDLAAETLVKIHRDDWEARNVKSDSGKDIPIRSESRVTKTPG